VKLVPVCDNFHVLEVSFLFVESVLDQLLDCSDRALGIIAVRFHLNLAPLGGRQREHTHDAAAVGCLSVLREIHLSGKLVDRLNEQSGGASVKTQLVFDLDFFDDLTHDITYQCRGALREYADPHRQNVFAAPLRARLNDAGRRCTPMLE
jgi:hypothetical protein